MQNSMQRRGWISNCCERRRIDFCGLATTLSYTRTICTSVRRERFCPGDFTVKTEPVVSNFVTSLRTVDSQETSFLPKVVRSFRTAYVAHSPFW